MKNQEFIWNIIDKFSLSEITRMGYIKNVGLKNYPTYDFFFIFPFIHAVFSI